MDLVSLIFISGRSASVTFNGSPRRGDVYGGASLQHLPKRSCGRSQRGVLFEQAVQDDHRVAQRARHNEPEKPMLPAEV
jgi:hypothetical protein